MILSQKLIKQLGSPDKTSTRKTCILTLLPMFLRVNEFGRDGTYCATQIFQVVLAQRCELAMRPRQCSLREYYYSSMFTSMEYGSV